MSIKLTDVDMLDAARDLKSATDRYERAIADGERTLRRADGGSIYSATEETERREAIRSKAAQDRDAVVDLLLTRADSVIHEADSYLAALPGIDPLTSLPPADQVRAAARAPFVQEDANRPMHTLEQRVAAVVRSGDRCEAILLARYMSQRGETLQNPAAVQRLNGLIEQLGPLTTAPDEAKRRENAQALRERGRDLRRMAWDATRKQRTEATVAEMRASGAYNPL